MSRLFGLTLLAMLAFAGNSLLNRWAVGGEMIDATGFALIRIAAGAGVLWVLLLRNRAAQKSRATLITTALSVGGLLAYMLGFSFAYLDLDAGLGALILFGMVQITMFIGAVIGQEQIPKRRWIGAFCAVIGLVALTIPQDATPLHVLPVMWMCIAGIGWGIYSLCGRSSRNPLHATATNFALALPIAIALCAAVPALRPSLTFDPSGIALAALAGALTSGLGYSLWYHILPQLGATRAAISQLCVPLIVAALGTIILSEPVTLRFAIAAAMILGGIAIGSGTPKPMHSLSQPRD